MQPWLGEEEVEAVAEVLRSGWVAQGPRVAEFERRFAESQQAAHAVATSSCTTALHLALVVAGIRPGDDVVVPSFSFVATANAAVYVGARPVFADVSPITGNLTPETVRAALTPATSAVVLVDQGGVPADLDAIREVCDPLGIVVIEDAACAAGSTYRGRPVGAGAEIAAWSFHPRKILTTGEGGMLTTSRADWAARARRLREHAMSVSAADRHASLVSPPESYDEVGFNFRMTDMQAAVGIVQLSRLPEVVDRRRELAAVYAKAVAEIDGLRAVTDPAWGTGNFQSFWIEVCPGPGVSTSSTTGASAGFEVGRGTGVSTGSTTGASAGFEVGRGTGVSTGSTTGASAGFDVGRGTGVSTGSTTGASAGFEVGRGTGVSTGSTTGETAGFEVCRGTGVSTSSITGVSAGFEVCRGTGVSTRSSTVSAGGGPAYGMDREGLLGALAEAGISARRGIMAAHRQPAYVSSGVSLPVTEHLTDNTLILPLFHQMSDSEQARVVEVLRQGRR
nr:DegT/DnrJ/EryC1/StrS family aminotransferase [Nocardioides panzhihuensis]